MFISFLSMSSTTVLTVLHCLMAGE
jgi:hypothetical protein